MSEAAWGRRLCVAAEHEGPRWLLAVFFRTRTRTKGGETLYLHGICEGCHRRRERAYYAKRRTQRDFVVARRMDWRLAQEKRRRAAGIPPRPGGPYRRRDLPPTNGRGKGGIRTPLVDAGPLLEVFERWRTVREGEMERERGHIGLVAIDELIGWGGAQAISRARKGGRMELATADYILHLMNSHLSIHDLWPDV